ncbi:BTAD domain-containing putative transcriptional regulator [Streptomyces sp. NPDC048277]|uniref:AfsR/SARP family transcriptional regulator n=1 Tax=Streptomyces sp. NPDC048277 TaxID=3155027 RepID=UPI0033F6AAC4
MENAEYEEGKQQQAVRFNILGPLEGWSGSSRLHLGGPVQERVLAMLLLEPHRLVPVSRLVEAVWSEAPPTTAAHQVRKAVAHLRRRIPGGSGLILTQGPGYRVTVDGTRLDLLEFTDRTATASRAIAEGRAANAVAALRRALALWRGPVLSGMDGPVIEAAATALGERHLAAAEQLLELRLGLGEAAELVTDLRRLISEHPLRETLRGHLMVALYRSGRQAEALEEYGKVRELLAEELGIDPGRPLTRLYEGILREAPELAAPERPTPPAPLAPSAPLPTRPDPASGRTVQPVQALQPGQPGPLGQALHPGQALLPSVQPDHAVQRVEPAAAPTFTPGPAVGTGVPVSGVPVSGVPVPALPPVAMTGAPAPPLAAMAGPPVPPPALVAGAPTGPGTGVAGTAPSASPAPCTLPYDLADFTGRREDLAALLACIHRKNDSSGAAGHAPHSDSAGTPAQRTTMVAIDGMGGSGKTSLAVRAARQVAALFPDGQLHIDLQGFTPGERSVTPAAALESLLRAVGTPAERIPDDAEGRAAMWRSALADRRVLLLLDNAHDTAQILPLLPPAHGCLVLVTSRSRLFDLDGAEWISIGPMSHGDGEQLLTEMLGTARVTAEPDATAELVELCGRLPLALRIVAARLRNRPRWTVRYLADRLHDETRRLEELSVGERSVAASLRLSYQAMDEEHRAAFRMLSLHPGSDLDAHSTAALLGMDPRGSETILERLLDVHLLQQPDMDLYRFHDLVRNFAQSQRGPATERDDAAAVERLLDYYLAASEEACQLLFPGRKRSATGIGAFSGELPPLPGPERAAQWFDREHTSLLSAVTLADRHGLDRHTVALTRNIVFQLNTRGRFEDFRDLSQIAVAAARRLEDLALLGVSLSNLGVACWKLGHFDEGIEVVSEGRDIARRLGDKHTEAHSESTIGLLLTVLGQHAEALPHLERAIALERELDIPRAEAETLTNLSTLHEQRGRYAEAAEAARQALAIHRDVDHRDNEVMALTDLAFAHVGLGEYGEARACLRRARERCDDFSPPGDFALVLALSAEVAQCLGDHAEVEACAGPALRLAHASDSPTRQAQVENLIGRLRLRRGEYDEALALHTHAHQLASAIRYRVEQARALLGMAAAAEALGDPGTAAAHRRAAAALGTFTGAPPYQAPASAPPKTVHGIV